ncbi:MAG: T9SS type A sorting domain-containing protein [Bacteroidia bacterium]|nr:T9SS type A sorting domain-containing protein [Bacteroidia bacterium]
MAAVTSMTGIGTNLSSAIDRWWDITSSVASPIPAVTLSLSYLGDENTMTDPADKTTELGVQHWSGTGWDDGKGGAIGTVSLSGTNGVATGIGTITVTGQTYFSPRVIVKGSKPLPIELLDIDGQCFDGKVNINWLTTSEENNDYFTIERSADSYTWEILTTVDGAGNSNTTKEYSVIDYEPLPGTAYYLLKQTDYDGKSEYSNIVTVNCVKVSKIMLFPNPTKNTLDIFFTSAYTEPIDVSMFDFSGKRVFNKKYDMQQGNYFITLDMSPYARGLYMLSVISAHINYKERVVKE